MSKRACTQCKKRFTPPPGSHHTVCPVCTNKNEAPGGKHNPAKVRRYNKHNPINNWRKNGIREDDCTQERFEWFFKKAGGRCEVCRILLSNPFARDPGLQTAHYDHCHISGRARGILCGTCNGRFVGALDRIAWKRYWGGTREKAIATAGYFLRTMKEADDA